jgi:hypothetical protein
MSVVMSRLDVDTQADAVLPAVLAEACVTVLGVAGAGLSMTDELRVPLGASDDLVACAESLQTTLGEGPCLSATKAQRPLIANLDTMATQWPMFHRELVNQTPFRSIASLPLSSLDRQRLGALDLYSTEPDFFPAARVAEIGTDIADPMAAILFDATMVSPHREATLSAWFTTPSAAARMNVWVAVGMIIQHTNRANADALAALRAYGFSRELTLEQVATELSTRQLDPEAVLPR